ncbi:MAG: hypothetical protein ACHQRL_04530 [Gemmatimonadales bacterium]
MSAPHMPESRTQTDGRTTLSVVNALAAGSPRTPAALGMGALIAAVAITRYAASWWLAGVLALGVIAAALAASADQWRARVRTRDSSRYSTLIAALNIYRATLSVFAVISAILFVLIGLALTVGSIGVGG